MQLMGLLPGAPCAGCDKETECVVLKTESYTAPHCAKCLFREMKKRSKTAGGNGQSANHDTPKNEETLR